MDPSRGDDLWQMILDAGEPYDIRVIAPSEARRIEAGIFNYGSDMTLENNPFELSGMERLVEEQDADYLGKDVLERVRREGVSRKLVGVEVFGDELPHEITDFWAALSGDEQVGRVTDLIWSPRLKKNIGYVWVPIEMAAPGTRLTVRTEDGDTLVAETRSLPFIDPKKEIPAA
jgi:aminomethyltransferase